MANLLTDAVTKPGKIPSRDRRLVELAHAAGHVADHVNCFGLGSSKDWQLMASIVESLVRPVDVLTMQSLFAPKSRT